MTTDPVHHAISAASDALRHLLRAAAAAHLRSARILAGDNAWTVQELRAAWLEARGWLDVLDVLATFPEFEGDSQVRGLYRAMLWRAPNGAIAASARDRLADRGIEHWRTGRARIDARAITINPRD